MQQFCLLRREEGDVPEFHRQIEGLGIRDQLARLVMAAKDGEKISVKGDSRGFRTLAAKAGVHANYVFRASLGNEPDPYCPVIPELLVQLIDSMHLVLVPEPKGKGQQVLLLHLSGVLKSLEAYYPPEQIRMLTAMIGAVLTMQEVQGPVRKVCSG